MRMRCFDLLIRLIAIVFILNIHILTLNQRTWDWGLKFIV